MDRYYFHIQVQDEVERGVVRQHPSLVDAIADAKRLRIDIMSEKLLDQLCIEIEDQNERIVATVPAAHR
jgi:hypothetical protein